MCSSLRRSGGTGAGACIRRSCACWFIGNAITSRMLLSPAMSMTIRSMPGAEPERVQHPAEARLHLLAAVPGDGERLVHDLGPVVPDRAARELDPVAHD